MTRRRVEPPADEYRHDLNPEYEAGEHHGPLRHYETMPAHEIKDLHVLYPELRDDELKRIPVVVHGNRLEQGAVYLDLGFPQVGEFTAMGYMEAGRENWYVPKKQVDPTLWEKLLALGGARGARTPTGPH